MIRLVIVGMLLGACGSPQETSSGSGKVDEWECRKRRVEYAKTGGLMALESGIGVACSGETASLTKFRVGADGKQQRSTHELTQYEFNELWKKIEAAGWRILKNCENPDAADDDPAYTIDIADVDLSVSLECQGKELPFPYDRLVNELDLKAAGFSN